MSFTNMFNIPSSYYYCEYSTAYRSMKMQHLYWHHQLWQNIMNNFGAAIQAQSIWKIWISHIKEMHWNPCSLYHHHIRLHRIFSQMLHILLKGRANVNLKFDSHLSCRERPIHFSRSHDNSDLMTYVTVRLMHYLLGVAALEISSLSVNVRFRDHQILSSLKYLIFQTGSMFNNIQPINPP
jgi:hypothetical protein